MISYIVTYTYFGSTRTCMERFKCDMKYIYWQEGKAPSNWREFDGDIVIKPHSSKIGDCVIVSFRESFAAKRFFDYIIESLKLKESIRSVEEVSRGGYNEAVEWVQFYKNRV